MQRGSFKDESTMNGLSEVCGRINQLSAAFRKTGDLVIHVQHDGSMQYEFIPETVEWSIIDSINVDPSDLNVQKTVNDAFYESELRALLDKNEIQELWITGSATDFCIEATIQSALTKEFNIKVIGDAHITKDRPFATAKQLINHYNYVWKNMTPTKGGIVVISAEEALG